MLSIQYDSTFDGFLSVVFEVYRQRLDVGAIVPNRRAGEATDLFLQPFWVETSEESARRLKRAIANAASSDVLAMLDIVFRSEEDGVEMKILTFLRKLFAGIDPNYGRNPASPEMLPLYRIAQSVRLEIADMRGMVRFSKTSDGTYFAEIEPKYDILEILTPHFRNRFANERWAIYDSRRNFGVYYDGHSAAEVTIPNLESVKAGMPPDTITQLWKDYYNAISIKERENPRLLRRCLPVRYWKHMPERDERNQLAAACPPQIMRPSDVAKANSFARIAAR